MSKRKRELCDEAVDFAENVGGFAVDVLKTASVMAGIPFVMAGAREMGKMFDEVMDDDWDDWGD